MKTSKLPQDRSTVWMGDPRIEKVHNFKIKLDFPKVHKFIGSPGTFAVYSNKVLSIDSLFVHNHQTFKITLIKKADKACSAVRGACPSLTAKTRFYEFKAELISSSLEAEC